MSNIKQIPIETLTTMNLMTFSTFLTKQFREDTSIDAGISDDAGQLNIQHDVGDDALEW